jgi:DNA-binding NarL/FixJ family response regulator
MKKFKLIVADDHAYLVEGILSILKEMAHVEIAAVAKNGFELMEAVALQSPDLVVLDLNMPGLDGLQCLQKIKTVYPATKVMVLTSYSQPGIIDEIKKLQAEGYLLKDSSATQLVEAI